MEPDSTIENLIEFALKNKELSISLGHAAFLLATKKDADNVLQELNHTLVDQYLVNENGGWKYKNNYCAEFFYSLFYISNQLNDGKQLNDILTKFNFTHLGGGRNLSYKFFALLLINLETYFGFDISKYIASNDINNILRHSFLEKIYLFNQDSPEFLSAIFKATDGIKVDQNFISIFEAFKKIGQRNPEKGLEIIQILEDTEDKAFLVIPFIFSGMSEKQGVEKLLPVAFQMLESNIEFKQKVGVRSLTMLHGNLFNLEPFENSIDKVLSSVLINGSDSIVGEILNCYGVLINKLPNAKNKIFDIVHHNQSGEVAVALSHVLYLNSQSESKNNWYRNALLELTTFEDGYRGIFNNLTNAFFGIGEQNKALIFEYLERYISNEGNNPTYVEGFKQYLIHLATTELSVLEAELTRWLNNDNFRFHVAAQKVYSIASIHGVKPLNLDIAILDTLSFFDVQFILYKIVGYIHDKEYLESLIFSSLKKSHLDPNHIALVVELFVHYVLYNYPGSRDFLIEKSKDAVGVEKETIERILAIYQEQMGSYKPLPKELRPSPERLQKLFSRFTEQINKSMGAEQKFKDPSILDFIRKFTVKNGKTSFRVNKGEFGKFQYSQKSGMNSYEQAFEPPKGEFTDPTGQAFWRYKMRIFKRRVN